MEHARRPNGWLYWTAVVVAAVLAVGGTVLALVAHQRDGSPSGVVADYFDALERADAPGALALGNVPHGSRELLTVRVLKQQLRIAPLSHVSVGAATRGPKRVVVPVAYTLGVGAQAQPETTDVGVHRTNDGWRLDQAAVATQLMLSQAQSRATVLGATVPVGSVLLFPGAAPVTFDTPYLELSPPSAAIDFQTGPTVELVPEMSSNGKTLATKLVRSALQNCLRGRGAPGCPLPDDRYVPGSLRGTLSGEDPPLTIDVGNGVTGTIEVTGEVKVHATYRRLDFRNRTRAGTGDIELAVHAVSLATEPMTFIWAQG